MTEDYTHSVDDVGWNVGAYITHNDDGVQVRMGEYVADFPVCPVCGYVVDEIEARQR